MKIQSSQQLEQECVKKLGIRRQAIFDAVLMHDRTEVLKLDTSELRFFIRKIPSAVNGSGLLVYGQVQEDATDTLMLSRAYRIYPDLCESAYEKRPTELLEAIARRFGLKMEIGGVSDTFFTHVVLQNKPQSLHGGDSGVGILSVPDAGKKDIIVEMLMKVPRKEDTEFAVSLAYCLDVERYVTWMRSHGR